MPLSNRLGLALLAPLLVIVIIAVWYLRATSQPATPLPAATSTAMPAAPTASSPTPTVAADTATVSATIEVTVSAAAPLLLGIDPAQSEARFIVDEILFGNPNTVVGSTADVSGTITVDLTDPTRTTVGPIRVNARSLATDNRFRNRSVNRLILQSNKDEYQYITLTPTLVEGLPDAAVAGETMNFQVTGDLQIRDIVQPVTFTVTVTATSESQLEGLAVATVHRADFDLNIPNVEGVADVSQDVRLELEFVAVAEE